MKANTPALIFCIMVAIFSCSKDDGDNFGPDATGLEGNIIYEYTSDVKIIDLKTLEEHIFFSYNAYSTNSWDLSKDGKTRLISEREAGTYTGTQFKLVDAADGSIIKAFEYIPEIGSYQRSAGKLSFDTTLILLDPDFDNGIVIMDTDGNVKHRLEGINDEPISFGDRAIWLPDNSILITFKDQFILKSEPPYTELSLVKEMNYESWGNLRVSMDGQKISLNIGNHIYLMDIDGSNLTQVTESSGTENFAEFSPDGRHLLVGTNYVHAPNAGLSNWRLKIMPADGQVYNVDESPEVVPLTTTGSDAPVKAGGPTFWRP